MSSTQGAKIAASNLAYHTFGRNPKTTGIVIIAMIILLLIFIILFIVYLNKFKYCESSSKGSFLGAHPLGNLNTGSNNPLWHNQMGDAGWGGSMHSTRQSGQPRVWGASAEGGHNMNMPSMMMRNYDHSDNASAEAQALTAAQAFDSSSSMMKNMNDETLMRMMNGGGV